MLSKLLDKGYLLPFFFFFGCGVDGMGWVPMSTFTDTGLANPILPIVI